MILLIIAFIIYALLEGKRERHYYFCKYYQNAYKVDTEDIHWLFTIQRGIVALAMGWLFLRLNTQPLLIMKCLETFLFVVSLGLIFSWFHNGMYYVTQHHIVNKDVTLKYIFWDLWKKESDGPAIWDFSYFERTVQLIIGLVLQILILIL